MVVSTELLVSIYHFIALHFLVSEIVNKCITLFTTVFTVIIFMYLLISMYQRVGRLSM